MENRDDETALLKVAEAVSDGRPVDWKSAQSEHDDAEGELSRLQALEVVADAYRKARLHPENTLTPAADLPGSGTRGEALPTRADSRGQSPADRPTGWHRVGLFRAWVILAVALASLYLILRLLWKF